MTLQEIEDRIVIIQQDIQITNNNLIMLHGRLHEVMEWKIKLTDSETIENKNV